MRAARFHEYGPAENLVVEEAPVPEPKEGEVLIRVLAAGVNPIDWKFRAGYLQEYMPAELPAIPGYDLAGTVEALGAGVTGYAVGAPVFGRGTGSYAEYATASLTSIARKPEALTFEEAATIGISGVTSWVGLFDSGGLQAGQRLLVNGAAGGTGSYAVQFGHWKGAHVIGTASARNIEYVTSLGADAAIDYTISKIDEVISDVDVAYDTVGGNATARLWKTLKSGGILVVIASMPDEETANRYGVRTAGVQAPSDISPILSLIADLIAAKEIKAPVGDIYSLDEVARSHATGETGHGRGRTVVRVNV